MEAFIFKLTFSLSLTKTSETLGLQTYMMLVDNLKYNNKIY